MESEPVSIHCRVCGLDQSEPPWGEDGRLPTFEICDCCGIEFGYEDATPDGVRAARNRWLARGAPWFNPKARPPGWDIAVQMHNIPSRAR
jgi:hypothetical protein